MINTKKTMLRHIINKLVKTSDREKILKSSQRGKITCYEWKNEDNYHSFLIQNGADQKTMEEHV